MSSSDTSFGPPRGMRDFYPEEMAVQNALFEAWKTAAQRFGFAQYDACVVETLDLLKRKAGEEIVEQTYFFTDKSNRELALRPEMTPTLARMVAARGSSGYRCRNSRTGPRSASASAWHRPWRTGRSCVRRASARRWPPPSCAFRRKPVARPPLPVEELSDLYGPHLNYTPPGGWHEEAEIALRQQAITDTLVTAGETRLIRRTFDQHLPGLDGIRPLWESFDGDLAKDNIIVVAQVNGNVCRGLVEDGQVFDQHMGCVRNLNGIFAVRGHEVAEGQVRVSEGSVRGADDVPAILLYQPVFTFAVDERVRGVQVGPLEYPSDRFRNIADWYIVTRRVIVNKRQP